MSTQWSFETDLLYGVSVNVQPIVYFLAYPLMNLVTFVFDSFRTGG